MVLLWVGEGEGKGGGERGEMQTWEAVRLK